MENTVTVASNTLETLGKQGDQLRRVKCFSSQLDEFFNHSSLRRICVYG